MRSLVFLCAVALATGCYSSSAEEGRGPTDGGVVGLESGASGEGGAVGLDSGASGEGGTVDGGDPPVPAGCTPTPDRAIETICAMLFGAPDEEPGPAAPTIDSFTWSYREPCSGGEPTWLEIDLELSDPDHATEDLVVCGILMGGGGGFFDPRRPSCQIAQTGGDSLDLAVADPAGNTSRVGAVVYGCSSGTWP